MRSDPEHGVFARMLRHRLLAIGAVLALTGVLATFAAKVRPDYSIEMAFPTFDKSRVDYERYKKDFPFEDARAIVVVEAADLFTPAGLRRVAALEKDLALIPGVVDTQGLTTVRDVVSVDELVVMDEVFPSPDLPAEELARRRTIATTDPLFAWNLAPPDGRATTIRVTLAKDHASREETRTKFLHAARAVLARHDAAAREAGVTQKLTLNGLPVIRSEFTEMINLDLGRLFPLALLVILVLLFAAFRSFAYVGASLATILFAVVWTTGGMGVLGIPLQILTQITPIVVLIVSISDTVHIVLHAREHIAKGVPVRRAVAAAASDSAMPCLLTEITIAGGFAGLLLNDMVMIQQFGLVTAIGMLFTWLANVTVLPLALSFTSPRSAAGARPGRGASLFARFVGGIERIVTRRGRLVFVGAAAIAVGALLLGLRAGKEYYSYDDLRPDSTLHRNLRYVEAVHGGTVPMAIYIEPPKREENAILEPAALALIDRIGRKLETEYPREVKNAGSIAKYLRKAHRILAGDEIADAEPLPGTRRLAVQELLALDDPRALRDFISFDRGTAAVFAMLPDEGSSRATQVIRELRAYFAEEERATGYRITLTGIYGIADGIYRSMVGGLLKSLGVAVLLSFFIFCLVLRSIRLALIALIPNLLPLLLTLGVMSLLGIDVKPSTVIVFSITLVLADDDTIQFLSRFRARYLALAAAGHPDAHREAALQTLRSTGLAMAVTASAVTIGFLSLLASQFLGLANLGVLIGVSLLCAVFADLFLTPLLIMTIRPRIGRAAASPPSQASAA